MKSEIKAVFDEFTVTSLVDGVAISTPGPVDNSAGIVGGISEGPYIHHFLIKVK